MIIDNKNNISVKEVASMNRTLSNLWLAEVASGMSTAFLGWMAYFNRAEGLAILEPMFTPAIVTVILFLTKKWFTSPIK